MVEQISLASAEFASDVDEFVKSGLTPVNSDIVTPKRVNESPFQMECKLIEMKSFGEGGGAANLAICEVLKFHIAEDLFTNGIIDPVKIDLVSRMSGNFYSRALMGVFEVEKPIGKKCIGYDRVPSQIRKSDVYTANDLGKFGNLESIPDENEVNAFIQKIINDKFDGFESGQEAFSRYQRLNDHKKMLKAAIEMEINKKQNIELAVKTALKNNDIDFAWKTAIFATKF